MKNLLRKCRSLIWMKHVIRSQNKLEKWEVFLLCLGMLHSYVVTFFVTVNVFLQGKFVPHMSVPNSELAKDRGILDRKGRTLCFFSFW
jgi:hypothetical protein